MLLCFGRLAGMRAHRRRRGREPSSGAGWGRSSGAGRGHRDLEFLIEDHVSEELNLQGGFQFLIKVVLTVPSFQSH
jgi:hypothetical protein